MVTVVGPKGYTEFFIQTPEVGRLFSITSDRRVILEADIYEAAKGFWEIVKQYTPQDYHFEIREEV